jgi:thiamine pyrophosphate-dependent acetolactate synthase large subunit-like protein
VVPGPGVLNTTAALCTAMGCNAPLLCLTGQVPRAFLGRGRGHLHELPDQIATLRSITKWAARIERAADVPDVIASLLDVHVERRVAGERFIDTLRRIGTEPYKERVYAQAD